MSIPPLLSGWHWLWHSNTPRLLRRNGWLLFSDSVRCICCWQVFKHCGWVSQCNDDFWSLSAGILLPVKKHLVEFCCLYLCYRLKLCDSKCVANYLLSWLLPAESLASFLLHLSKGLLLSSSIRNCWH